MYVKSTAVALQALSIISIGTLADSGYWRKRLLLLFAGVGACSATIFLILPGSPYNWLPIASALITLVGNVCYATSIVCANAFLPGLAREDPRVVAARHDMHDAGRLTPIEHAQDGEEPRGSAEEEVRALLSESTGRRDEEAIGRYAKLLSSTMSRLSAVGTAIGFFSGVSVLALLVIPVTIGKGSTRSMEIAVGLSGLWWGVFTIPAAMGLPSSSSQLPPKDWLRAAWRRVGGMIRPKEIRELPNLFLYLLAWIFLSDGMCRPRSDADSQDSIPRPTPPFCMRPVHWAWTLPRSLSSDC